MRSLWDQIWDEMWNEVLSLNPRSCTTSDPDTYPVSADKLDQALSQLNISVLEKVQNSGLYEPEPPLPEAQGDFDLSSVGDFRCICGP